MAKFLEEVKSAVKANELTDTRLANVAIRTFGLSCNNGESGVAEVEEGLKYLIEAAPTQAKRTIKAIHVLSCEWKVENGKTKFLPDTQGFEIDGKTGALTWADTADNVWARFKAHGVVKQNMWALLSVVKAEANEQPMFTDEELLAEQRKFYDRLYKNKRTTAAQRQALADSFYRANGLPCPTDKK